jgi:hypothetical protein
MSLAGSYLVNFNDCADLIFLVNNSVETRVTNRPTEYPCKG